MGPKVTSIVLLVLLVNVVPFTVASFIVPEEFATLLGLVFSTIPQVKKGTDSRIGFGYRFGNHADTQVILELGPQKNTQKLGSSDSDSSSFNSKREVDAEELKKITDSRDWIMKWSQHMAEEQKNPIVVTTEAPVEDSATVKVKPFIAESSLQQLVQLYKRPEDTAKEASSNVDSVVQFQDKHKVFLKRPSQEKLDNLVKLKQHEKKKVSEDLMDVDLE